MERASYYVPDLKPLICEEILETLDRRPPNVLSNINDIRPVAADTGRFQRGLLEHTQPRESLIIKNSQRKLPLDGSSTKYNFLEVLELGPHLHLQDVAEVDCKLKKVLLLESISTADNLQYMSHHNSQTDWVVRCFKISNKSLQKLNLIYSRPYCCSKGVLRIQLLDLS